MNITGRREVTQVTGRRGDVGAGFQRVKIDLLSILLNRSSIGRNT
jgi:hypothetical protein